MDEDNLSSKICRELEEITQKMGYLLGAKPSGDRVSLEIINEFLKCNQGEVRVGKPLMSGLMLIGNHLINDSIKEVLRNLDFTQEDMMILQIYLRLQMSSNFLDGFFLGYSFIKTLEDTNILESDNVDVLEVFRNIYLLRMKQGESDLIDTIDRETGLINHFRNAYNELFLSNSTLLKDMARENIDTVVHYLMITFFDGILTAKVISENIQRDMPE